MKKQPQENQQRFQQPFRTSRKIIFPLLWIRSMQTIKKLSQGRFAPMSHSSRVVSRDLQGYSADQIEEAIMKEFKHIGPQGHDAYNPPLESWWPEFSAPHFLNFMLFVDFRECLNGQTHFRRIAKMPPNAMESLSMVFVYSSLSPIEFTALHFRTSSTSVLARVEVRIQLCLPETPKTARHHICSRQKRSRASKHKCQRGISPTSESRPDLDPLKMRPPQIRRGAKERRGEEGLHFFYFDTALILLPSTLLVTELEARSTSACTPNTL